jgi:hypothetical protein
VTLAKLLFFLADKLMFFGGERRFPAGADLQLLYVLAGSES